MALQQLTKTCLAVKSHCLLRKRYFQETFLILKALHNLKTIQTGSHIQHWVLFKYNFSLRFSRPHYFATSSFFRISTPCCPHLQASHFHSFMQLEDILSLSQKNKIYSLVACFYDTIVVLCAKLVLPQHKHATVSVLASPAAFCTACCSALPPRAAQLTLPWDYYIKAMNTLHLQKRNPKPISSPLSPCFYGIAVEKKPSLCPVTFCPWLPLKFSLKAKSFCIKYPPNK